MYFFKFVILNLLDSYLGLNVYRGNSEAAATTTCGSSHTNAMLEIYNDLGGCFACHTHCA